MNHPLFLFKRLWDQYLLKPPGWMVRRKFYFVRTITSTECFCSVGGSDLEMAVLQERQSVWEVWLVGRETPSPKVVHGFHFKLWRSARKTPAQIARERADLLCEFFQLLLLFFSTGCVCQRFCQQSLFKGDSNGQLQEVIPGCTVMQTLQILWSSECTQFSEKPIISKVEFDPMLSSPVIMRFN